MSVTTENVFKHGIFERTRHDARNRTSRSLSLGPATCWLSICAHTPVGTSSAVTYYLPYWQIFSWGLLYRVERAVLTKMHNLMSSSDERFYDVRLFTRLRTILNHMFWRFDKLYCYHPDLYTSDTDIIDIHTMSINIFTHWIMYINIDIIMLT